MNLYEALKSGTSEEELSKAFSEELKEATTRIAKEKEKIERNKQQLTSARELLADALVEYMEALFGIEYNETYCELIEIILKSYEEEATKSILNLSKELNDFFNIKDKKIKTNTEDIAAIANTNTIDDEIINQFLKSLK